MQVGDIIEHAAQRVGLGQPGAVPTKVYTYALRALNQVYREVWTAYPFRDEKLVTVTVSVAAATERLILPDYVDAVRALRTADTPLSPLNEFILTNLAPEAFAETGDPVRWFPLADSPVLTQPTGAGHAVTVVSSSTADTAIVVRVFGRTATGDAFDNITLTGTTPAVGTVTFTELLQVSKDTTTGRVAIRNGATEIGSLAPWSDRGAYRRLRLYPVPDAAVTLYLEGTRRYQELTNDSDVIGLARAESAVIGLLMAELYDFVGEPAKAAAEREKAAGRLEAAVRHEEQVDGQDVRIMPEMGLYGDQGTAGESFTHVTY